MQDIDLPLKEECGTCFGHGFLVYDYGSMAPIKNVPCEICDGFLLVCF